MEVRGLASALRGTSRYYDALAVHTSVIRSLKDGQCQRYGLLGESFC